MKFYFVYVMIGAGLFLSCATAKLKTDYGSQEIASHRSDAFLNQSSEHSFLLADSAEYDVLWWLKGNARWHPDSGMVGDELLIRYRGKDWHSAKLLDSQQRFYKKTDLLHMQEETQLTEKQQEQKGLSHLPGWVYVLMVLLGYFLGKRFFFSIKK